MEKNLTDKFIGIGRWEKNIYRLITANVIISCLLKSSPFLPDFIIKQKFKQKTKICLNLEGVKQKSV